MQLAEGELRTHTKLHHALKGAAARAQAAKPHTDLHELTTQMLLHRAVKMQQQVQMQQSHTQTCMQYLGTAPEQGHMVDE